MAAANQERGEVDIVVDGKRRVLRIDFRAALQFKERTKKTPLQLYYEKFANLAPAGIDPAKLKTMSAEEIQAFAKENTAKLSVGLDKLIERLNEEEVITLFWCGLLHENRELTFEEAVALAEKVEGDTYLARWQSLMTAVIALLQRLMVKESDVRAAGGN